MDDLAFQIINELLSHKEAVSSGQLAMSCSVSSKSIQRCISALRKSSEAHGYSINTKTGIGTEIVIHDEHTFKQYLSTLCSNPTLDTPEKRKSYILQCLLYSNDYIKLYDLAEELFVSLSLLNRDLKEIKKILAQFHLHVVSKPNTGIRIEGEEKDKRRCIAQLCFHEKTTDYLMFANQLNKGGTLNLIIEQAIIPVLSQKNMHVSDVAAQSLAIHLLIASERIKNNHIITLRNESQIALLQKDEYSVAEMIAKHAESVFQIRFPTSEICYLTQHILGKRHYESNIDDYKIQSMNDQEVLLLVNKMLRSIFDHTKIDFFYDRDLKKDLILHMIPFIDRMKNNLTIHNPILDDIKKKYSFAFELSAIGCSVVGKYLKTAISEDEISYFALHFILALERRKEIDTPVNILIICSTGRATSQLLAYQIKKKFASSINTIKIIEYYMLDTIDIYSYDYAFSTVPIEKKMPIPVQQISSLPDIQDYQIIEEALSMQRHNIDIHSIIKENLFYTDITGSDRTEVLCSMIQKLKKDIDLPDDFLELILERESFAATDLVNGVALPHPNRPVSAQSFVSIGVLKHPVLWETKHVQIVFLISIAPAQEQTISVFFEMLSDFVTQEKKIRQFLKKPSYDYMIQLIC